jgi:hypothetical protein
VALLVDAHDAGVLGLGEHRVAPDVAVVLVGDPRLVGEVGRADQAQQRLAQLVARRGTLQPLGGVVLQVVLVGGP